MTPAAEALSTLLQTYTAWAKLVKFSTYNKTQVQFSRHPPQISNMTAPRVHFSVSQREPALSAHQALQAETLKATIFTAWDAFLAAIDVIPHLQGVSVSLECIKKKSMTARLTIGYITLMDASSSGHIYKTVIAAFDQATQHLNALPQSDTPLPLWGFLGEHQHVRAQSDGEALLVRHLLMHPMKAAALDNVYQPGPFLYPDAAAKDRLTQLHTQLFG